MVASLNGHVEVVKELIRASADVNARALVWDTVALRYIYMCIYDLQLMI